MCCGCGKRFSKRHSLTNHLQENRQSFQCQYCPHQTPRLSRISKHTLSKHGVTGEAHYRKVRLDVLRCQPQEEDSIHGSSEEEDEVPPKKRKVHPQPSTSVGEEVAREELVAAFGPGPLLLVKDADVADVILDMEAGGGQPRDSPMSGTHCDWTVVGSGAPEASSSLLPSALDVQKVADVVRQALEATAPEICNQQYENASSGDGVLGVQILSCPVQPAWCSLSSLMGGVVPPASWWDAEVLDPRCGVGPPRCHPEVYKMLWEKSRRRAIKAVLKERQVVEKKIEEAKSVLEREMARANRLFRTLGSLCQMQIPKGTPKDYGIESSDSERE